jgi:hypothetical protein
MRPCEGAGLGYKDRVLAHALATLRFALRAPMSWGLAAASALIAWFAIAFAVLALRDDPARRIELIGSTSVLAGLAVALWCLVRMLEEDSRSGFALAADASAPGPGGRLAGRWLGACVAATATALISGLVTALVSKAPIAPSLLMCSASIVPVGVAAGWAVLGSTLIGPGRGAALAALLWLAGHLPWGRAPLPEGVIGAWARAWLPGPPQVDAPWVGLPAALAVAVGLVILATWVAERAQRADPMV